jgi:nitric oxide synthase oxygenase domain/subunit
MWKEEEGGSLYWESYSILNLADLKKNAEINEELIIQY